jgi:hypothetical protein
MIKITRFSPGLFLLGLSVFNNYLTRSYCHPRLKIACDALAILGVMQGMAQVKYWDAPVRSGESTN